MDFEGLHRFTVGMIDKAAILKKGNAQPNVAIFARFAPYGREGAQWFVKQALDIGLMGVIFNGIDNPDQALLAVRNMRYPQKRTSKYPDPPGLRGYAPATALWWWGVSGAEYERRADVWPLNPDGDLLAIMMIETAEGLKNADAIAAVPGVGAIFVGAGGDLHQYLGVDANSPEVGASLSDYPEGLPGSQRGLRHHCLERARRSKTARRRLENDSHQRSRPIPMASSSGRAIDAAT